MFPATGGTPVYSVGDQLWLRSHFQGDVTISVAPVFSSSTSVSMLIPPDTPTMVMRFNGSEPEGLWTLKAANTSTPPLFFDVSFAASDSANLTISGHRLEQGSLALNFSTAAGFPFYDGQACVLGVNGPSTATIQVPPAAGTGSVYLQRNGTTLTATTAGTNQNFSFSAELYYSYSFLSPNSTDTLVSRSVRVAVSDSVTLGGTRLPTSLSLESDTPMRPGTYDLRAFFEGQGGLALASTEVIIPASGPWVWIGACQETPVYSNDFSLTASLKDPATWPGTVWLTYKVYGVEGFAEVPVGLNLASVSFLGEPWGVRLSSYTFSSNASSAGPELDVSNGTVYMIMKSSPVTLNYTLGLGGRDLFSGMVGPILPFTASTVRIDVSRLTVIYFAAGKPYAGGNVSISDAKGELASSPTGASGSAVFYLPAGAYNITASGGGGSTSRSVSLAPQADLSVDIGDMPTGENSQPLMLGLLVAATVAALANVSLLVRGWRKRRGLSGSRGLR